MTLKRLLGLDTRADRYSYGVDPVAGYVSAQKVPDKWIATTCGYCSVGCGMYIGVKGGRAVSVAAILIIRSTAACSARRGCPSTTPSLPTTAPATRSCARTANAFA